jgi:hypothetical protein
MRGMSVESRAFIHLLQHELTTSPDDADRLWEEHTYWTRFMLGDGASRRAGDFGAIGRVGKLLGYHLQAEYFRVDQVWYTEPVIGDWHIDGYFEHENSIARLEETVRKLLQLGPGLKVVITYPDLDDRDECLESVRELIRNRHGTSSDTRLAVVFGFLAEKRMRLEGYEFDGMGRCARVDALRGSPQS